MEYPVPRDEVERVLDLKSYDILDSEHENAFQNLINLAAQICRCPMGLIGFIEGDRHWVKAQTGLDIKEIPRSISLCAHTIMQSSPLISKNTMYDRRFNENPLVISPKGVKFYAGVPLISPRGNAIGVLCVSDYVPRNLAPFQVYVLEMIAKDVMKLLEERKNAEETRNLA